MSYREKWSTLIQGWINEGKDAGKEPTEIRARIDARLAKIDADRKALKLLESKSTRKPLAEERAVALRASITTTQAERAGYSPRLIRSVTYALYQRNRMLTADEKGKARDLWKLPLMNPTLSPSAVDYKSAGARLGIPA